MNAQIKEKLEQMAEEKYRLFNQKLLPGVADILGVRAPALRKLAQQLAAEDWQAALEGEDRYYEETLLRGMVIAVVPVSPEQRVQLIRQFVPQIQNWGVCDSFCASLRPFAEQNRQLTWELAASYMEADREFSVRFGIVLLLEYFLEPDTFDRTLVLLDMARYPGYYVRTALAWALSLAYFRDRDKTLDYLRQCDLEDFTYHKTLQKIKESHRASREDKALMETMRRDNASKKSDLKKESIPPQI